MVSDHLLPRPYLQQWFFIGLYQASRSKKDLTISSISLTTTSSSPDINSLSTTKTSSGFTSTASDVSDASTSSEISYFSTDNTLNMITTPWTTESWSGESILETFVTYSGSDIQNTMLVTSLSLNPESTTSIGGVTPDLNSENINTLTLFEIDEPKSCFSFNLHSIPSSNSKLKMKTKRKSYSESTFDSWTVESFTSFVEYSDSKIIKVRYPWSPCTYLSGTDIYPDSVDTVDTFRGSVISLITSPTLDSIKQSVDILTSSTKVL